MSLFGGLLGGGGSRKLRIPPQILEAMNWLEKLYKQPVPSIPTRQIAGMTPTEQMGQQILSDYATTGLPETFQLGRRELMKTAEGDYADLARSPYFEPLISRIGREGAEEVNRLMRGLQIGGMGRSTPAAKMLGSQVQRMIDEMMGTLAPYAEAERGRQFAAIPQLQQAATYEEKLPVRKMGAISAFGALPRQIEQEEENALFNQLMQIIMFPYQVQAPIAQSVMGAPIPATTTEEEPSILSQIQPMLQAMLPFLLAPAAPVAAAATAAPQYMGGGSWFTPGTGVPAGSNMSDFARIAYDWL